MLLLDRIDVVVEHLKVIIMAVLVALKLVIKMTTITIILETPWLVHHLNIIRGKDAFFVRYFWY